MCPALTDMLPTGTTGYDMKFGSFFGNNYVMDMLDLFTA